MTVQLHPETCIGGVELHHGNRRGACWQLVLRHRIDLCSVKPRRHEVVLIGGDVEAIRIGTDVRIVTEARTVGRICPECAVMVRSPLGSAVLHWNAVDVPCVKRIGGHADSSVEVVGTRQSLSKIVDAIERQHYVKPALCVPVEKTAGIREFGTEFQRSFCSVDCRNVTAKAVQRGGAGHRIARSVKDLKDIVDGFEHKTISAAKALIGRFQ